MEKFGSSDASIHALQDQEMQYGETCSCSGTPKTTYACIVEADESTTKRLEGTLHEDHEDRIAGKGIISLSHYTPNAASNENTGCESCSGENMKRYR